MDSGRSGEKLRAEHEELCRYGCRYEFPWDVPTWKDVKQAAVGRDYVIRLKTDGAAFCAGARFVQEEQVCRQG